MKFLIYGEDTYRSRKKLAAARERFSATRDTSGMNAAVFRAGQDSVGQVTEAIFASPFLAEKKLVVLEGFLKSSAADQKKLADALARKPESTVVVLYEPVGAEALGKSHLFESLKDEKFSEEFPALSVAMAEKMVMEESAAAGAPFEPKAAKSLVLLVGAEAKQIHEEVSKITSFALGSGMKSVTDSVVMELVADGREAEIFAFLDAVTEGRTRESSRMLEGLLSGGSSEIPLIAMILKQYRAALAARDMVERGGADAVALAKALGMHPFPAGKAIVFARKHDRSALERAYEKLVKMEHAAKSGGPKSRVSLAVFLASV